MKARRIGAWAIVMAMIALSHAVVEAQEKKADNTAIKPVPKDKKRHEGFVALAKKGGIDVLFLGDSITDGWRGPAGQEAWKKYFEPLHAANFGIGGDRTQHVLWRIQNGELEGIHPKLAVLMIGTNNMGSNSVTEIADGITTIVQEIHPSPTQYQGTAPGHFPPQRQGYRPIAGQDQGRQQN